VGVDGISGWFSRHVPSGGAPLVCAGCGGASDERARGWRGYRADIEDDDDPRMLEFVCPICAGLELDA
jgi:hypothetical protein